MCLLFSMMCSESVRDGKEVRNATNLPVGQLWRSSWSGGRNQAPIPSGMGRPFQSRQGLHLPHPFTFSSYVYI